MRHTCTECKHYKKPNEEDVKRRTDFYEKFKTYSQVDMNFLIELRNSTKGMCTFDPAWIKVEDSHYCSQFFNKND